MVSRSNAQESCTPHARLVATRIHGRPADSRNPGLEQSLSQRCRPAGLPSAAFVETVFARSGFELTPGLSSASSCPEAIWQSAKWWTNYYEDPGAGDQSGGSVAMVPRAFYI